MRRFIVCPKLTLNFNVDARMMRVAEDAPKALSRNKETCASLATRIQPEVWVAPVPEVWVAP